MTGAEASTLIRTAGGPSAFGRLLGINVKRGWQQRVNNWKRRGIPPEILLEHQDTIRRLRHKTSRRSSSRAQTVARETSRP
jgi:hypothetical protein